MSLSCWNWLNSLREHCLRQSPPPSPISCVVLFFYAFHESSESKELLCVHRTNIRLELSNRSKRFDGSRIACIDFCNRSALRSAIASSAEFA